MDAPLSVKRLLEQVKARVEPPFASVRVLGEVSGCRSSGPHTYFTLKEEGAALSCAVWGSQRRLLAHPPKDGERVVVRGSLDLYVARGSLTLVVSQCEAAGAGDLQARLRELEARLRAEGLFDRPRRPLPRLPRRIGVVAALGGAALRDILEVTGRRAPGIPVLVAPAAAQGERCVPENLLALQEVQDPHWGCDLVLLARGGGSPEDLWGFNDPELVRAVAACRLPVVTGVGHEIDTTLVDLAADLRAATPSQAAELATPDRRHLAAEVRRRADALVARMARALQVRETRLNLGADRGLRRLEPLEGARRRLEALDRRLRAADPRQGLERRLGRLALLRQRLTHAAGRACGEADRPRVLEARRRLAPAAERCLQSRGHRLGVLAARLRGLDPKAPLRRGFVLALDAAGRPVVSAAAPGPGEALDLRWLDGSRRAVLD